MRSFTVKVGIILLCTCVCVCISSSKCAITCVSTNTLGMRLVCCRVLAECSNLTSILNEVEISLAFCLSSWKERALYYNRDLNEYHLGR